MKLEERKERWRRCPKEDKEETWESRPDFRLHSHFLEIVSKLMVSNTTVHGFILRETFAKYETF